MKKNLPISLLLGAAISLLALYLAFRNVPFNDLLNYLKSIEYVWGVPAALISLATFVLRTFRWQVILASACRVRFWSAFHPLMVGFMLNCVMPGRIGELARPIILSKREKVPFATGLATVAAERVFDVTVLILFFAVVLAKVQIDPDLVITYGRYRLDRALLIAVSNGTLQLCLVLIAGIVVVSMERSRRWIHALIAFMPHLMIGASTSFKHRVGKRLCDPLTRIVDNVAVGFELVKNPRRMAACLMLSVAIWFMGALSYYVMARGCLGISLSFLELSAVMIIVCFFIALPAVPGFWGLWEAGGVFALSIFGVASKDAAGYTLVNHAVQMFPVIIVGLVSAIVSGVNVWRITRDIDSGALENNQG